jgi:uncharacterized protein YyaL (SSP411 family)
MVVLAFERLYALTHEERWQEKARALLDALARRLSGAGLFAAGSALGAGLLTTPGVTVVVEGSGEPADALLRAARRSWHPNLWVFAGRPVPPFALPATLPPPEPGAPARALVCAGTSCAPPVTEPAALPATLDAAGRTVRE